MLRKTESGNLISPAGGVVGSKFNQQRWKASTPLEKLNLLSCHSVIWSQIMSRDKRTRSYCKG